MNQFFLSKIKQKLVILLHLNYLTYKFSIFFRFLFLSLSMVIIVLIFTLQYFKLFWAILLFIILNNTKDIYLFLDVFNISKEKMNKKNISFDDKFYRLDLFNNNYYYILPYFSKIYLFSLKINSIKIPLLIETLQ